MTTWKKEPFTYKLLGLIQGSSPKKYEVVLTTDSRDGRRWVSCSCPSYVRGRQQRNKKNYERECKHTCQFSITSPEIDFPSPHTPLMIGSGGKPRDVIRASVKLDEAGNPTCTGIRVVPPENQARIPFQKPQLPARWQDKYEDEVYYNPNWVATVKMDGHRCLVVKQPYGTVELFSRGGKRMLSAEPAFQDLALSKGTMLDTELVVDNLSACDCQERRGQREAFESVAHFRSEHPEALGLVVLDVLFVDGQSVMLSPHRQRRLMASSIVAKLGDVRAWIVEMKPDDVSTEDWLVSIRSEGAEGAVFWNKNEPYRPGIRSSTAMLKKKWGRLVDVDVVVVAVLPPTEKTPGHRLAYGYADGERVGIVPGVRGDPFALERHVGQVVELKAHEVLPSGALLYPEFVRFRDDKVAEECVR